MRRAIYSIDPRGARPEVVTQMAEDTGLPVLSQEQDRVPPTRLRGRFDFLDHVRLALLKLIYGHMPFEQLYSEAALEATGQARLRKLEPRFPASLSKIDVDPSGDLKGIRQWATKGSLLGGAEIPIPVQRLVYYVNEREGAAWQGQSILLLLLVVGPLVPFGPMPESHVTGGVALLLQAVLTLIDRKSVV